jgi:hypothetical protein
LNSNNVGSKLQSREKNTERKNPVQKSLINQLILEPVFEADFFCLVENPAKAYFYEKVW